jgi:hypothetical protein
MSSCPFSLYSPVPLSVPDIDLRFRNTSRFVALQDDCEAYSSKSVRRRAAQAVPGLSAHASAKSCREPHELGLARDVARQRASGNRESALGLAQGERH